MFLTIQFPLFDKRYLLADSNRAEKPNWPKPEQHEKVRYFGEILERTKKYEGPWDDEKRYCDARSVLNFCGTGAEHFFRHLQQSVFDARITFRRFQSDGKCLSKFEVGFNDRFESTIDKNALNNVKIKDLVFEHIKKYLLTPIKVRVGNKLSSFIPLVDAAKQLSTAAYWATTKDNRTFAAKDMQGRMEHCEPALLVQLDSDQIDFSQAEDIQRIDMPELADESIQLYYQTIPYKIGRYNYHIKTWVICLPKNIYTDPQSKNDYHFYNNTLRYLRINLLRIHVETVIQKKFLNVLSNQQAGISLTDQQEIIKMYTYLHKLFLNLSNIKRNKQPQECLVEAAFRLDEKYAGTESLEELLTGINYYRLWLKTLALTPATLQVIKYLDDMIVEVENKKIAEGTEKVVFISYNHKDETTAQAIKKKLEAENIKVIIDSVSMKAGTGIGEFIGESLRAANATISIVSNNSLLSGWVAMETVNMLNFNVLYKDKKFVPCVLDEQFLQPDYLEKATIDFDKKLATYEQQIQQRNKDDQDTRDINIKKSRIRFLRENLDGILAELDKGLYVNIEGDNLEKNWRKIVESI